MKAHGTSSRETVMKATRNFRSLALLAAIAVAATVVFFFLFGSQGVVRPFVQQKRDRAAIAAYRRTVDSLQNEIRKLTNDTAYIERMAREKLGMARRNETVYKFIEKKD